MTHFHGILDEWRRSCRDLDGFGTVVYRAHMDEHPGAFRTCSHPTCRAAVDLGLAA